jgi:hypothetical protein
MRFRNSPAPRVHVVTQSRQLPHGVCEPRETLQRGVVPSARYREQYLTVAVASRRVAFSPLRCVWGQPSCSGCSLRPALPVAHRRLRIAVVFAAAPRSCVIGIKLRDQLPLRWSWVRRGRAVGDVSVSTFPCTSAADVVWMRRLDWRAARRFSSVRMRYVPWTLLPEVGARASVPWRVLARCWLRRTSVMPRRALPHRNVSVPFARRRTPTHTCVDVVVVVSQPPHVSKS